MRGNLLFVTMLHSERWRSFRINQNASRPCRRFSPRWTSSSRAASRRRASKSRRTGGQIYVANFQTEDVSFLERRCDGNLARQAILPVGVTPTTPDPTTGGNGQGLFATDEEVGLRWFFSSAYSDDGQKSCGFCHWDGRQDGCQWNVAANAVGGVKVCPQNKDISDNWPEWYEGLNNDFMAYASACNGEVLLGERARRRSFRRRMQTTVSRRAKSSCCRKTEENSAAIGRPDLSGKAFKIGYYDMAYLQILWSQNESATLAEPAHAVPRLSRGGKDRARQSRCSPAKSRRAARAAPIAITTATR